MRRCIAALAVVFLSDSSLAQQPGWQPHVDVEAKPGTKRSLGEADFFLPFLQDGRTLLFGNARLRISDHDNREGNLGLGVRRMLDSGWNIGGYAYADSRRTESGNRFGQVTLGVEALGRDWDLRGNVYMPAGDRTRDLAPTAGTGAPTVSIVANVAQVTTPGMTLREERALKGLDAELGWRLPILDAEDRRQLRIYAGGYRFSDEFTRVSGPRVRLEVELAELEGLWRGARLTLGAEAQRDDVRGSQQFLSVRLRIPLGKESSSGAKMSAQARRMTTPVVRDVDIVTASRVTGTAPAVVEAATVTLAGAPATLLSSDGTTGAALPGAVAAAGANSTVVLAGSFSTTATTTLQPGQTLLGSSTLTATTASGKTVTFTTPAGAISSSIGVSFASTIVMSANSTVRGLTLTSDNGNDGAVAIKASGGNGLTISGNTLNAGADAGSMTAIQINGGSNHAISGNTIAVASRNTGGGVVGLEIVNAATGTITGNTITATGGGTIESLLISGSSFTVSGNALSASGGTFNNHALRLSGGTINAGSIGNTRTGTCDVSGGPAGSIGFDNAPSCP